MVVVVVVTSSAGYHRRLTALQCTALLRLLPPPAATAAATCCCYFRFPQPSTSTLLQLFTNSFFHHHGPSLVVFFHFLSLLHAFASFTLSSSSLHRHSLVRSTARGLDLVLTRFLIHHQARQQTRGFISSTMPTGSGDMTQQSLGSGFPVSNLYPGHNIWDNGPSYAQGSNRDRNPSKAIGTFCLQC